MNFKDFLISLLPKGPAYTVRPGSDLGKIIAALAERLQAKYDSLSTLADVRDARYSDYLDELEKEFCLLGAGDASDEARRQAVYASETAVGERAQRWYVQQVLNEAGFDIEVVVKDPAVNPALFASSGGLVYCSGDNAYFGFGEAYCGFSTGEICANGGDTVSLPVPDEVFGDSFAGDAFCGGYTLSEVYPDSFLNLDDIPSDYWKYVFYVGKKIDTVFEWIKDPDLNEPGPYYWTPVNAALTKIEHASEGTRSMAIRATELEYNQAPDADDETLVFSIYADNVLGSSETPSGEVFNERKDACFNSTDDNFAGALALNPYWLEKPNFGIQEYGQALQYGGGYSGTHLRTNNSIVLRSSSDSLQVNPSDMWLPHYMLHIVFECPYSSATMPNGYMCVISYNASNTFNAAVGFDGGYMKAWCNEQVTTNSSWASYFNTAGVNQITMYNYYNGGVCKLRVLLNGVQIFDIDNFLTDAPHHWSIGGWITEGEGVKSVPLSVISAALYGGSGAGDTFSSGKLNMLVSIEKSEAEAVYRKITEVPYRETRPQIEYVFERFHENLTGIVGPQPHNTAWCSPYGNAAFHTGYLELPDATSMVVYGYTRTHYQVRSTGNTLSASFSITPLFEIADLTATTRRFFACRYYNDNSTHILSVGMNSSNLVIKAAATTLNIPIPQVQSYFVKNQELHLSVSCHLPVTGNGKARLWLNGNAILLGSSYTPTITRGTLGSLAVASVVIGDMDTYPNINSLPCRYRNMVVSGDVLSNNAVGRFITTGTDVFEPEMTRNSTGFIAEYDYSFYSVPTVTNVRYVSTTGNDSNNGQTPTTPYRTVNKAFQDVNANLADTVEVAEGTYSYDDGSAWFRGSLSDDVSRGFTLRGVGDVRFYYCPVPSALAWTVDPSYPNTFKCTVPVGPFGVQKVGPVMDTNQGVPSGYSDFDQMTRVYSLAECNSTQGTFYVLSPNVWVHTLSEYDLSVSPTVEIGYDRGDVGDVKCTTPRISTNSAVRIENISFIGTSIQTTNDQAILTISKCSFRGYNAGVEMLDLAGSGYLSKAVFYAEDCVFDGRSTQRATNYFDVIGDVVFNRCAFFDSSSTGAIFKDSDGVLMLSDCFGVVENYFLVSKAALTGIDVTNVTLANCSFKPLNHSTATFLSLRGRALLSNCDIAPYFKYLANRQGSESFKSFYVAEDTNYKAVFTPNSTYCEFGGEI